MLLCDGQHRGVIEAGGPVVLRAQPDAVVSGGGGGAYPLAELDFGAERVGTDDERRRIGHRQLPSFSGAGVTFSYSATPAACRPAM